MVDALPQKQKDVIYDKLNRREEPITHVTSSPPQLDNVYFTQKNDIRQASLFNHSLFPVCCPKFWLSRIVVPFQIIIGGLFLALLSSCLHSPFTGSRGNESFVFIFLAGFLCKHVFYHILEGAKEFSSYIVPLLISISNCSLFFHRIKPKENLTLKAKKSQRASQVELQLSVVLEPPHIGP